MSQSSPAPPPPPPAKYYPIVEWSQKDSAELLHVRLTCHLVVLLIAVFELSRNSKVSFEQNRRSLGTKKLAKSAMDCIWFSSLAKICVNWNNHVSWLQMKTKNWVLHGWNTNCYRKNDRVKMVSVFEASSPKDSPPPGFKPMPLLSGQFHHQEARNKFLQHVGKFLVNVQRHKVALK